MVLKSDQERVMGLLKDTITLLCKNGLNFKSKFCVDAVIGVTVDEDELFYISVKEVVKSEKAILAEKKDDSSEESDTGSVEGGEKDHKKRRRKRRLKDENAAQSEGLDTKERELGEDFSPHPEASDESSAHSATDYNSSAKRVRVKKEGQEEQSDEDIVFIKQELDDNSWSQSQDLSGVGDSSFANFQGQSGMESMQSSQHDQNFPSLTDMNLTPVNPGEGSSGMWSSPQQRRPYVPRGPRTSTVTSNSQQQQQQQHQGGNMMVSGEQGEMDQQQQVIRSGSGITFVNVGSEDRQDLYECSLCLKQLKGRQACETHERHHQGIYRFYCDHCSKGFDKQSDLKSHVNAKHLDTKLFQCEFCSNSYNFRRGLVHHIRVKHGARKETVTTWEVCSEEKDNDF